MRRADRLIDLVSRLRGGGLRTAAWLAERLEVSERTIYRDIATLQSMGLPIDGAAGLGYVMRREAELPPMTFSLDQGEALALGLAYVAAVGDEELARAARAASAKIEQVLPIERRGSLIDAHILAVQRAERRAPPITGKLRHAIRQRLLVSLRYMDLNGSVTDRMVEPLALTAFSDGWMLGAWCRLRQDFRDFRLDRVEGLAVGPEHFDAGAGHDLPDYLERQRAARITPGSGR